MLANYGGVGIGAGRVVYTPSNKPIAVGADANEIRRTITRAKLAAISVALESDLPEHILLDSAISLHLIERMIYLPVTLRHDHKVLPVLEHIVHQLRHRANLGLRTIL